LCVGDNALMMKWFEQHENFQLGDFVMLTSGLRALSELWGSSINVFFNTSVVRDLYIDCDFINILKKKPNSKPFGSSMFSSYNNGGYRKYRLSKRESMQSCFFRFMAVKNGYKKDMPHTYVDSPNSFNLSKKEGKKYIALFHGCLGNLFIPKKSIPNQSLDFLVKEILRRGFIPVLLGSSLDNKRFWTKIDLSNSNIVNYIGKLSIRDSVSVLSQCDCFISNDTGLYHVSGALKKEGLILWNNTDRFKNAPSYSGIKQFFGKDKTYKDYNNSISSYLDII
jgi:ADP-heptose:LPS heptosyltransferase